jgi:oxygen-independent coproporphyrinogen-3 oxidase
MSARETGSKRKRTAGLGPEPTFGDYFVRDYPPLAQWAAEDGASLTQSLLQPCAGEPMGLQVHLPFCRQRCLCCNSRVYPGRNKSDVQVYIRSLVKERRVYALWPALQERRFRSVYLGGGSPTYLSANELRQLTANLLRPSEWAKVEEFTVECESATLTKERARVLKDLGATRMTLGFQSLNDDLLQRNGCGMRTADCLRAYDLARGSGVREVVIELVAGMPGETEASWGNALGQVLALKPDALTLYPLEMGCQAALFPAVQAGTGPVLRDWPARRRLLQTGFSRAEGEGYTRVSAYTVAGSPERWRMVHSADVVAQGQDLLALGQCATGHLRGMLYQNAETFESYVDAIANGRLPAWRTHRLKHEEALTRELVLQLKSGALDLAYFRAKFGTDLRTQFADRLNDLAKGGWLELGPDSIHLTAAGLLCVDRLLPRFYPNHG